MTIFHDREPPWFSLVQHIKPGQKKRLDDSRIVSNNGKGFFLYDFREKEGEVYEPQLTLAEKIEAYELAAAAALAASASADAPLPALHHPSDWPLAARVWLYKAHFNNTDILASGFYWNAKMRRVVLPFHTLSGAQSWIARDVGLNGNVTKYLFPLGVARGGGAVVNARQGQHTERAIVTEDLLSARRVATATGIDCVAANGTTLDRDALVMLAQQYNAGVGVWLDPDIWGQRGANKIINDLGAFDVPTFRPKSEVDPKLLDDEVIRNIVAGAR